MVASIRVASLMTAPLNGRSFSMRPTAGPAVRPLTLIVNSTALLKKVAAV